ncbi:MAG: hypothetical protein HC824_13980 [Synechococcales cyanobacterium RM1_1_8]|nr:hypothetical protein [Synechococcales cyanobacterium RM1_1_8]
MGQSSVATAVRPSPAEALAQGPSCALSGNNLQGRGSGRLSAHLRSQAGDWPRSAAGKRSGFRQARLGFWQRLVGLWPFQGRLGHGDRPSQSNPLGQRRSPWKGGRPSQGRPEGTKGAGSRSL